MLKIICGEVHVQERFCKDSDFLKVLLKYFVKTFQNAYWEKYIFQWHLRDVYGYFPLAEIHQTTSFSMLQTKKIKKSVRDCSLSFMKLEQLIFTWKGRHLVSALLASMLVMIFILILPSVSVFNILEVSNNYVFIRNSCVWQFVGWMQNNVAFSYQKYLSSTTFWC